MRWFLIITGLILSIAGLWMGYEDSRKKKAATIDWPNIHHVSITVTNLSTNVIRFNIDMQ